MRSTRLVVVILIVVWLLLLASVGWVFLHPPASVRDLEYDLVLPITMAIMAITMSTVTAPMATLTTTTAMDMATAGAVTVTKAIRRMGMRMGTTATATTAHTPTGVTHDMTGMIVRSMVSAITDKVFSSKHERRLWAPFFVLGETLRASSGYLVTDLGWKHTILVWPGEAVRIAINFTHPFSGDPEYLFHCNNVEHEDAGMMNYRRVTAADSPAA